VEAEYKGYSDDLRLLADGREIVADIASRHPTATTLLDVGCGSGNILAAARERGWTACGVEVTEGVASRARELSGADVHVGDFMELPLSGPFDVVVMWQVLEHLPDPRAALQKVKNLMAPQGLLLITVPNFASTASQKQGPQWSGLKPGFHLYHYTPESLTRLLALTGFGKTEVLARSAISLKRAGEAHGGLRPLTSAARRLWRLQPRRVQKLISHRAARLAPGEGLWAYTHA
jgi:SAM-dependent methyltransferase